MLGPSTSAPTSSSQARPHPRVITELPPPSQLDIDWSPVLTRNNERILKLGNLNVTVTSQPHSPNSRSGEPSVETPTPKKTFRFFGGNTSKRRTRLVMVTSSARIVLAASGGDEKKAKFEVSLVVPGTTWKTFKDGKGITSWCVDTVSTQQFQYTVFLSLSHNSRQNISYSKIQKPFLATRTAVCTLHKNGWKPSSEQKTL